MGTYSNINHFWGAFLVEKLWRLGLREAVVSPGSRSAPLALAAASHAGIRAFPVLDERSAAFLALGMARARRRPVALICTSGTAGANWFPAVIEAAESRTPLLLLTADRPPEMRECGSGQTIDQQKMFGRFALWQMELPLPEADHGRLAFLGQTLAHAWERSLWPSRGPVHLNLPFRDPLAPVKDGSLEHLDQPAAWALLDGGRNKIVVPAPEVSSVALSAVLEDWPNAERGLIVAGPEQWADPEEHAAAVGLLSAALGWPVLVDGLSSLRERTGVIPFPVCRYERILVSKTVPGHAPKIILRLGPLPVGPRLRSWLGSLSCPQILVDEGDRNIDPLHKVAGVWRFPVTALSAAAGGAGLKPKSGPPSGWARDWMRAEAAAAAFLHGRLDAPGFLFEGKVSQVLSRHLPEETPVFVANSMPVRDVDFFWKPGQARRRIHFSRGANGIDGTLSTALGMAIGYGKPAVLLTGDLAFLHDANALLSLRFLSASLTVILLNNRGGGIFEHLPIAGFDPPFEEFFAMPQSVDIALLAKAHGAVHARIEDEAGLISRLSRLPESGLHVWEIATDRKRDASFRKSLFEPEVDSGKRD